jgi:hypothetical protein
MLAYIIGPAPQCRMLRNCHEEPSAWDERRIDFTHHSSILSNVFEHVERPNEVEGCTRGNLPGIQLREFSAIPKPLTRIGKPCWVDFRAHEPRPFSGCRHGGQDSTSAASNFELTFRLRKKATCKAYQQTVARLKPEMPILPRGKLGEGRRIEANRGICH